MDGALQANGEETTIASEEYDGVVSQLEFANELVDKVYWFEKRE